MATVGGTLRARRRRRIGHPRPRTDRSALAAWGERRGAPGRNVTNGPGLLGERVAPLSKTEEADMTDLGPDSGTVLLVVPEDADHFTASVLEKLEHRVITSHGPTRSQHCPLVHGQGC